MFRLFCFFLAALCPVILPAEDETPRCLDSRLKIELFAEAPNIVTPTGIDVDHLGRVWAIESNTHFPPAGYAGHPTDRVLVLSDTDGDNRADKIVTFTDGLKYSMSVAVRPQWLRGQELKDKSRETTAKSPETLSVYIATRREIFLFHDDDGDLKADRKVSIVRLETEGDYPHNGLAGLAFDALGWMYFGFGENLGADYKIIGSDGTTYSGGAEGGNIYRCKPDGSKLTKIATGFWNPHASCVDAFGRLFTVDNDPDSRPPCRLLHIIPGGDYGYRFRNGRKGLHPFTAWNGEIPGTLPMVAGTGEAPSGIIAYELDGLPADYIGNLIVPSWGDHRIDRFQLKPKGASFVSIPETIIQGGENFRPVGIATAPDGSLFLTDWVLRDYKLHGKGRIWRVSMKEEPKREVVDTATITEKLSTDKLASFLASPRLGVRRQASSALATTEKGRKALLSLLTNRKTYENQRIEALWGVCRVPLNVEDLRKELRSKLIHDNPSANFGIVFLRASESNQISNGIENQKENARLLSSTAGFALNRKVKFPVAFDNGESFREILENARFESTGPGVNHLFSAEDSFFFSTMVQTAAKSFEEAQLAIEIDPARNANPRIRLGFLLAAKLKDQKLIQSIRAGLKDPSHDVQRAVVQWVAEERLNEFRPQVEVILNSKTITTDLFLATLAALEMLDGVPPQDFDKTPASKYVLPILKDNKRSAAVRTQALRLVDPADESLTAGLFKELLASNNAALNLETVRTLQHSPLAEADKLLLGIARDEKQNVGLRSEAIAGLASAGHHAELSQEKKEFLLGLVETEPALRSEALRSLRGHAQSDPDIQKALKELASKHTKNRILNNEIDLALGKSVLSSENSDIASLIRGGKPASGRRAFFHANSAGCYKCHTVNGRGGKIGPDLSFIARTMDRKKLAESILNPSKEIAPQFTMWTFLMSDGKTHNGMLLGDTRDKAQKIGTVDGKILMLQALDIEERVPQKISLMPEKLVERMTAAEFRDLVAFLETLK